MVLRYFDCRSRGQALRFTLADSGVSFEDRRTPIEELTSFRERATAGEIGGPFASLPLLEWQGNTIAQTLAIAGYLSDELKLGGHSPDPGERAFRGMVSSAAHLDMQIPFSRLLWMPEDCSGEKLRSRAQLLLAHLVRKTEQMEALLSGVGRTPFFGGSEPDVPDYFLYESVSRSCAVFGEAYSRQLARLDRVARLTAAMEARPRLRAWIAGGRVPFRVTASPSEPVLRRRLLEEGEP